MSRTWLRHGVQTVWRHPRRRGRSCFRLRDNFFERFFLRDFFWERQLVLLLLRENIIEFGGGFVPATRAHPFQVRGSERASSCFNAPRHSLSSHSIILYGNILCCRKLNTPRHPRSSLIFAHSIILYKNVLCCRKTNTPRHSLSSIIFWSQFTTRSLSRLISSSHDIQKKIRIKSNSLHQLRSSLSEAGGQTSDCCSSPPGVYDERTCGRVESSKQRQGPWRPTALLLSPSGYATQKLFPLATLLTQKNWLSASDSHQ